VAGAPRGKVIVEIVDPDSFDLPMR